MLTKNHKVIVESGFAMELVKVLGKYGIRFRVSDEYVVLHAACMNKLNRDRAWHRTFTIYTTKRTMDKIMTEFYKNVNIN